MRALVGGEPPQRVHVVVPSGAGKTSLILKVVGDMARRELAVSHEVLILRVGDRPGSLASPEAVMKLVLDTIAVEDHRFANVDPRCYGRRAPTSAPTTRPRSSTAPVSMR